MSEIEAIAANAGALGLVYDGLGITILGLPAFLRTRRDLRQEAETHIGYNSAVLENAILLRLDTAAGSILLIIGFALQLIDRLGATLSTPLAWILGLFLPAYPVLYWFVVRRWLCHTWREDIIRSLQARALAALSCTMT